MLTKPESGDTLEQALYRLAARTSIELDAERLQPTLRAARIEEGATAAVIEIAIPGATLDMKMTAAHLREIADLIEAAADKTRAQGGGGIETHGG